MKHNFKKWRSLFVGSIVFLALVGRAAAQSPAPNAEAQVESPSVDVAQRAANAPASFNADGPRLTYQGRLTTSGGLPVTTPVTLTFRLYDDDGAVSYTETLSTTPINGLFTVELGANGQPSLASVLETSARLISSIGVTVGDDAEMTPRQPFNTVVGHAVNNGAGVVGHGYNTRGVAGFSIGSTGVWGESTSYTGVYGRTNKRNNAGVWARGSDNQGIALKISDGAIQVSGAGTNTPTTAFIHVAAATNTAGNSTTINHPLLNENPKALVFITHNWNPPGATAVTHAHPTGVLYSAGLGRWVIYNDDNAAMPVGIAFNVLIVIP